VLKFDNPLASDAEFVLDGGHPAGGRDGHAFIDQLTDPGRQLQLVARVAAVPAAGAVWRDQSGLAKVAQEVWGDAEHLGRCAHAVRRVVNIIELSSRSRPI
jgi:hypothetical protein